MTSEGDGKRKTVITVAIVVIVASFCVYTFYDLNGGSFDLSDREALLIVTDSMDGDVTKYDIDSFPKNTFVMVKHLSEQEKLQIHIGDVLSFRYNGILDHHRVIETHFDQGYVITHGDNTHSSENVTLSSINGEVIGTNHWLGALVSFVKDNFLIVIAVIAAIAIIGEIYRAYKDGVFKKEGA
ncbi:MAG: S24/S26 family peptidase [Candidatus Methanomethylophilaceae archaeon]|nr:S24/S26 family peptidase [Candidatus Methanomethylophilaceae archaeon]MBR6910346.1 S24/S26 family peptidase [Candidatus Methanomethylophilaceae archaeon]